MFRQLARIGVLTAALASALALSSNAVAAPSTPQLNPIPPNVFLPVLAVSWSPASFDSGVLLKGYQLDVTDLTDGSKSSHSGPATSKAIGGLQSGHKYLLRLRAYELTQNFQFLTSGSDWELFTVKPFLTFEDYYEIEIRFPPDPPWCLRCPDYDFLFRDDPVLERVNRDRIQVIHRENIVGVRVDARGEVSGIAG